MFISDMKKPSKFVRKAWVSRLPCVVAICCHYLALLILRSWRQHHGPCLHHSPVSSLRSALAKLFIRNLPHPMDADVCSYLRKGKGDCRIMKIYDSPSIPESEAVRLRDRFSRPVPASSLTQRTEYCADIPAWRGRHPRCERLSISRGGARAPCCSTPWLSGLGSF